MTAMRREKRCSDALPNVPKGSSARAHLAGRDDGRVEVAPLIPRCGGRFADLIAEEPAPALIAALRAAEPRIAVGSQSGGGPPARSRTLSRPARGADRRDPRPQKRGRKPRLEVKDAE